MSSHVRGTSSRVRGCLTCNARYRCVYTLLRMTHRLRGNTDPYLWRLVVSSSNRRTSLTAASPGRRAVCTPTSCKRHGRGKTEAAQCCENAGVLDDRGEARHGCGHRLGTTYGLRSTVGCYPVRAACECVAVQTTAVSRSQYYIIYCFEGGYTPCPFFAAPVRQSVSKAATSCGEFWIRRP